VPKETTRGDFFYNGGAEVWFTIGFHGLLEAEDFFTGIGMLSLLFFD